MSIVPRFHCKLGVVLAVVGLFSILQAHAFDPRRGANLAEPGVFRYLETLPLQPNAIYSCDEAITLELVSLAADEHINVFELIDCMVRYAKPRAYRFKIVGNFLRATQDRFDLGGERVLKILAIDKLDYLEFGANLTEGQSDLDIYMSSTREAYIEIGTARYAERFGFKSVSPLLFDKAYGIMVTKLFIKTPLTKLELFSPGKGAIYVSALSRPKRWNLDIITPR